MAALAASRPYARQPNPPWATDARDVLLFDVAGAKGQRGTLHFFLVDQTAAVVTARPPRAFPLGSGTGERAPLYAGASPMLPECPLHRRGVRFRHSPLHSPWSS